MAGFCSLESLVCWLNSGLSVDGVWGDFVGALGLGWYGSGTCHKRGSGGVRFEVARGVVITV